MIHINRLTCVSWQHDFKLERGAALLLARETLVEEDLKALLAPDEQGETISAIAAASSTPPPREALVARL